MPLFLVRLGGLLVPPLVVPDDLARVLEPRCPSSAAEQGVAPRVQRPAHLLHRHLRVFPPAAGPCGPTRTPSPAAPGLGDGSARRAAAPRNAPTRLPTWP